MAAFILGLLVWQLRVDDLLPPRSPRRIGVVAAVAAGVLGCAVNDSGIVVTAVVLVFVAPFLTLLALAEDDPDAPGRPVLLEPALDLATCPVPAPTLPTERPMKALVGGPGGRLRGGPHAVAGPGAAVRVPRPHPHQLSGASPCPPRPAWCCALAALAVEGGRAVAASFGVGDVGLTPPRVLVLVAAFGYGVLGLVDDLLGSARHKGFRGHGSALLSGQVTSGMLKLAGGGAVALVVVAPIVGQSPGRLVADALLVGAGGQPGQPARPGAGPDHQGGAGAGSSSWRWGWASAPGLVPVAVVVGAALGLLLDDLHERLMLGDAGANPLGAVLGLAVVLAAAPGVRDVVLVALVTLNVAGELVSFSRVIDLVPPLRALDRAGRRR